MGILGATGFYGTDEQKPRKRGPSPLPHDPNEDGPVPTEEQDGDEVVSDWTYDPTPSETPKRQARGGGRTWIPLHRF